MPIKEAIKDLDYQSESDCLWNYQEFKDAGEISCDTIKRLARRRPGSKCTHIEAGWFFYHLVMTQPQSQRYFNLYTLLIDNLKFLVVFRLPSMTPGYNYDVYVVGINPSGTLVTLMTSGVET